MEIADFSVAIEHLPPGYAVYAALFTDVANSAFLQSQLIARNADFEYALVDAAAVVSRTHLLAAVYKAVLAHNSKTLKTPNVHSETVLSLSPSLNVSLYCSTAQRSFPLANTCRSPKHTVGMASRPTPAMFLLSKSCWTAPTRLQYGPIWPSMFRAQLSLCRTRRPWPSAPTSPVCASTTS